jgi:hypothetical protein
MTRKRKVLKEAQAEYRSFYIARAHAKNDVEEETTRCERKLIILLLSLIDHNIYNFKIAYENMYEYIYKKYGFDLNDKPLKRKEENL